MRRSCWTVAITILSTVVIVLGGSVGASPASHAAGRPADLDMPVDGDVRLRVRRGSSDFWHHLYLAVDRAGTSPGWDATYDLGVLAGTVSELNTGVSIRTRDRLDVIVEGHSPSGAVVTVRYSTGRSPLNGEALPRVIDHDVRGGRHYCGVAGINPESPIDLTDLFVGSDHLVSLSCWEDWDDFDYNDFALAVDYTPLTIPSVRPTPTPTPPPRPAYLPLALRERCSVDKQFVDVAVVIDASTSMRDDPTPSGRTKLGAALAAAELFVDALALPRDRAAIVGFNADAWIEQPLTGHRADLITALGRLPGRVQQHSRIDRGVSEAQAELLGSRRLPGNRPVMVVLTDGLANPEPVATAVERAAEAKGAGITIFTIGLGDETHLDIVELEQMATGPDHFYRTPDAEDLASIYKAIAVDLPCPGVRLWGGR